LPHDLPVAGTGLEVWQLGRGFQQQAQWGKSLTLSARCHSLDAPRAFCRPPLELGSGLVDDPDEVPRFPSRQRPTLHSVCFSRVRLIASAENEDDACWSNYVCLLRCIFDNSRNYRLLTVPSVKKLNTAEAGLSLVHPRFQVWILTTCAIAAKLLFKTIVFAQTPSGKVGLRPRFGAC
jgi:hypothetical protein